MRRFVTLAVVFLASGASPYQDRLWHLRNLGKAFYENPTTQREAVDQFKQALDLAPDSARERVNYGLALLRAGETERGVNELRQAQKQDPAIPHTWFNLGIVAKRNGDYTTGIEQMRRMVQLVPGDAKTHYNLATLLKLQGNLPEALSEFEEAEKIDPNLAGPHFQLYTAYRQAHRQEDANRELALFQEIKKRQAGAPIPEDMEANNYTEILDTLDPTPAAEPLPEVRFRDRVLGSAFLGMANLNNDILAWSQTGVQIFESSGSTRPALGLEKLGGVVSVEAGDYDNDGYPDLCVVTASGASIYHSDNGSFSLAKIALPEGRYRKAIWIDFDHDYDLDLMLLGEHSVLMRNNGDGTFLDVTQSFPFVPGTPTDAAQFALRSETAARDLFVSYESRPPVVYKDMLNGVFQAIPVNDAKPGSHNLIAADFDHDGFLDIAGLTSSGVEFLRNVDGTLKPAAIPAGVSVPASMEDGEWVGSSTPDAQQVVSLGANFALLGADGSLHFMERSKSDNVHSLTVALHGIKNLKMASAATVEIKAGALYQKKIYLGSPLYFDMRGYTEADTVRITWPNGLIQNEPQKKTDAALSIEEAQRLSGSCPMIFTWNGRGLQFITDVLGVAPLGASSADGKYFPVDHDEFIQIPGDALQSRNGSYEVRITEELHEVSYLDQMQLIALDHPAKTEIFTNDKFKSPPFPEFRLFGVDRRVHPRSARDGNGKDVLPFLLHQDLEYPATFPRNYAGVAETHMLDLDFGSAAPDNRAVLVLNGWVDWADGSTFLAESQRKGGGLVFPYLQVKDAAGKWRTVVEDLGIPSGKPKSIAVDLSDKFLSSSREIRIVTNLCVYWDEVFLSEESGVPAVHMTHLDAARADLHFRGFSMPVIHPERKQPERFDYEKRMPLSSWNPTRGMYTRYGDVRELVTSIDDRFLVMGSGDEVILQYPSAGVPALPSGWKRDFLLLVDGWAKDADANTAYSQSVEPLPFHGMSAYPYGKHEHFPDDPAHREYLRRYQIRPALRLIRPLTGIPTE
ncbi:MAG: FG-GAP-like repeat-containing protein [Bryobacteraceae bacterium]